MKNKTLLTAIATSLLLSATPVMADTSNCQPIYGGGNTCIQSNDINVDKFVQNPENKSFVDNLGINDYRFNPESNITFRIIVKNTSNKTQNNIEVKDTLPQYVDFVIGPSKTFDTKTKTLSFKVDSLKANESRNFEIVGKTSAAAKLPNGDGITCMTNQAQATQGNKNSSDNAQFCVQKSSTPRPNVTTGVLPKATQELPTTTKGGQPVYAAPTTVQTTPKSGPEMLALIGLIPAALTGAYMRRKSTPNNY